jgi:hypothetical protein
MVASYHTTSNRITVECSLKPLPVMWRVRRYAHMLRHRMRILA